MNAELLKKAEEIARKAHEGQFRHDKITPYIVHPLAVMDLVDKNWNELRSYSLFPVDDYSKEIAIVAAAAHDVFEDSDISCSDFFEYLNIKDAIYYSSLNEALFVLNKNNFDSYKGYILAVKKVFIARIVKICDLRDNLKDLKPGSLRDKYQLAEYILLN